MPRLGVLLVCWLSVGCQAGRAPPLAHDGELDLRTWDFQRDGAVALAGNWAFYWNRSAHGTPDAYVGFGPWNGTPLADGSRAGAIGFAAYRLKVLLPPPAALPSLTLRSEPADTAYRLSITTDEGTPLAGPLSGGEFATSPDAAHSLYRRDAVAFSPEGDLLLTLDISNFETWRGGPWSPPFLGESEAMAKGARTERDLDFLAMGLLLVIALHHFGLFALRRTERPPLYFAILCLLFVMRTLVVGRYFEQGGAGPRWWSLLLRLEYLSYYGGTLVFVLFLRSLFPTYTNRRLAQALLALSAISVAIVIALPPWLVTATLHPFQIFTLLGVAWAFSVLVRAMLGERDALPLFMLLGFVAIAGTAVVDILKAQNLLTTRWTAHFGLAVFVVFQSLMLAVLNQRARRQLERRNEDVHRLNAELRLHIGDRSNKLARALGRLADERRQPTAELAPGFMLGGRYRIVKAIGSGGMGTVYHAERVTDGQKVAIKVIQGAGSAALLARFAQEGQVAAAIDHPNVVAILDIDITEEGELYLAMELVDGPSLESLRPRFGDAAWALPLLAQLARALEAIHDRGVVHRDVKPANVLLAGAQIKLADFGVASLRRVAPTPPAAPETLSVTINERPVDPRLTHAGTMLGSPLYMAPELAQGSDHASTASDVFSFGLVAYEMLTGRHAFADAMMFELLAGRMPERAPPLATTCPTLPPALADMLDQCLSLDATTRPTAPSLVKALAAT